MSARHGSAERLTYRVVVDCVVDATVASLGPCVRDALDTLPMPQRRVIVLAYYEGYTYQDLGEVLSEPIETIQNRMREGLIALRAIFREQDVPLTIHRLTGAHVLDAMIPDERDDFEQHVRGCLSCINEVREMRETVSTLALGGPDPG
jgi:hypothetical protein